MEKKGLEASREALHPTPPGEVKQASIPCRVIRVHRKTWKLLKVWRLGIIDLPAVGCTWKACVTFLGRGCLDYFSGLSDLSAVFWFVHSFATIYFCFHYRATKLENRKAFAILLEFSLFTLFLFHTFYLSFSFFLSFFFFFFFFPYSIWWEFERVIFFISYCTPFLLPFFHSLLLLLLNLPSASCSVTVFMMCIICYDSCSSGWWHSLMYVMSVDENDLQSLSSVPMTFVSIFNWD